MMLPLLAVLLLTLVGCTLPGHQGGPRLRSTQFTYPGASVNPDTGLAHSPVMRAAEPDDGGRFVFGLVLADGSTATSMTPHETRAQCERERADFAALALERVKEGAAMVATVKCFRSHETPPLQAR